jgi:hypothetical protein
LNEDFVETIEDFKEKYLNLGLNLTTKVHAGSCLNQAATEWIVIRGPLKGHNNTRFGKPIPGRPTGRLGVGHPEGVLGFF